MAQAEAIEGKARPSAGVFAERTDAASRLQAIDILRGLVICLMVLDHVRDFFHYGALAYDPLDPKTSYFALYATRWVTHLCAPTFVLLAGVSAFLKGARTDSRAELSIFLLTRGLWLILLEVTVVNFGWTFGSIASFFQVIWAIGIGMVALSGLVWFGPRVTLIVGVLIVAGHNLLDPIAPAQLGAAAPLWNFTEEAGIVRWRDHVILLAYPALPWFGIMALGYGLGPIFLKAQDRRIRWFLALGLGLLAAFVVLRALDGYGDPLHWSAQADLGRTAMSFFNVNKYPPSLLYDLATLGAAFLLLAAFERLRGWPAEILLTYGRVPLFVYVAHIYLMHGLQVMTGVALGWKASTFVDAFDDPSRLAHWGFSLPVAFLIWLAILAALYPPARWFGALKRRRRDWWLGYL
jgi:uncharacterized membrane protein